MACRNCSFQYEHTDPTAFPECPVCGNLRKGDLEHDVCLGLSSCPDELGCRCSGFFFHFVMQDELGSIDFLSTDDPFSSVRCSFSLNVIRQNSRCRNWIQGQFQGGERVQKFRVLSSF